MSETKEFYIDSDGIRLHAKQDVPEGVKKGPLCILIHGFTGNMEEAHLLEAVKAMNDTGVMVLRVEMYGHGESDGEFGRHTLYKWITNALSVIEYAKALDNVTDLYLCGHSQGGLLTMLIGGMCPDELKAIIPLSPAWMIPDACRRGEILGASFDPAHIPYLIRSSDGWDLYGDYVRVAQTIHVEDEIARYNGPVLIVHGMDDTVVPYSYGEEAARLYKNARLIGIKGAQHCFEGHEAEMADAIREYLAEIGK